MSNVTNLVDEALGIFDPVEAAFKESEKTPSKVPTVITPASSEDDIDNDYKYQRENLYSLIERGQDAIDGILELADVTDKLIDLQDKMKKLKEVPGSNAPKSVTNALFVGSTAELQKMLKGKSDG